MSRTQFTDEYFLEQIQLGNESALGTLYKMHYPSISHFILQNNGSEQEAKDIYQEAIIAFYEKLQSGNLQLTCKISTYLYSICRRLWLKKLSGKAMYTGNIHELESFIQVDQEVSEIELQEHKYKCMTKALAEIREPCRTILEDYYIRKSVIN